jgi:hypothetical protein
METREPTSDAHPTALLAYERASWARFAISAVWIGGLLALVGFVIATLW